MSLLFSLLFYFNSATSAIVYLFSANLTLTGLTFNQSFVYFAIVASQQNQNHYSLLHPILYIVILTYIINSNHTLTVILWLFLTLGTIWAYFYNNIFWCFDFIEFITIYLIAVVLIGYHIPQSANLLIYLMVFFLTIFKFQLIDSFHSFVKSTHTLPVWYFFQINLMLYFCWLFYIMAKTQNFIYKLLCENEKYTLTKYHI